MEKINGGQMEKLLMFEQIFYILIKKYTMEKT